MKPFAFNNGRFYENDRPHFIASAEFQYFRTPREDWSRVLRAIREAQCNCVSTYIPWNWHEPQEGFFDFDGQTHPCRDLKGYLDLVREAGLRLIVKPGPFIHNEWKNGGIPNWLTDHHPEILALGPDGRPSEYQSYPPFNYMHPFMMERIGHWFSACVPLLTELDNIILWQVDNETSFSYTFMNGTGLLNDFHPLLVNDGWYQRFLRERYGDLEILNRRYRSAYGSFSEVEPPRQSPCNKPETLRVFDWIHFKEWLGTHYLRACCEMIHERGAQGPFILNAPFHGFFSLWRELVRALNSGPYQVFVTHCDYPGPVSETTVGEILSRTEFCKSCQNVFHGNNEIQACNVAQRWGNYGTTYDLIFKLVAGNGLGMINYYWFCDGMNPLDYGEYSDRHEYFAPLSKDLQPRPHYHILTDLNQQLTTHPEWLEMEKVYEISLGYLHEFHRMSIFRNALGVNTIRELDQISNLLALSSISFKIVSMDELDKEDTGTLLVPCPVFMPRAIQQALLDYIAAGNHLILIGRLPNLDENLEPCTILSDALPLDEIGEIRKMKGWEEPHRVKLLGITMPVYSAIQTYRTSLDSIALSEGQCCGFTGSLGLGHITVIGLPIAYFMDLHKELICRLLGKQYNSDVIVWERCNERERLFTLLNIYSEPRSVMIEGQAIEVPPKSGMLVTREQRRTTAGKSSNGKSRRRTVGA